MQKQPMAFSGTKKTESEPHRVVTNTNTVNKNQLLCPICKAAYLKIGNKYCQACFTVSQAQRNINKYNTGYNMKVCNKCYKEYQY